jgi:hypothetical protein
LLIEEDWQDVQRLTPVVVNTQNLADGVYIYRVKMGEQTMEDRLMIGR